MSQDVEVSPAGFLCMEAGELGEPSLLREQDTWSRDEDNS